MAARECPASAAEGIGGRRDREGIGALTEASFSGEHPRAAWIEHLAQSQPARGTFARGLDAAGKRTLDIAASGILLLSLLPLIVAVAAAIRLDSPGPVFFRCRRVGYRGRDLQMLKFRKMHDDARGPALTVGHDERFTRVGRRLAKFKLDEIPQLWNVLRGEMSLVGPRPEDPEFVALHREAYDRILQVRPGVTGLSQLAFAEEGRILDPGDILGHYLARLLPQKVDLDLLYVRRGSLLLDLRILLWTTAAVIFRRAVAVHRHTGRLNLRRRR